MLHNCETARLEILSVILFYCQILVTRVNVMLLCLNIDILLFKLSEIFLRSIFWS